MNLDTLDDDCFQTSSLSRSCLRIEFQSYEYRKFCIIEIKLKFEWWLSPRIDFEAFDPQGRMLDSCRQTIEQLHADKKNRMQNRKIFYHRTL